MNHVRSLSIIVTAFCLISATANARNVASIQSLSAGMSSPVVAPELRTDIQISWWGTAAAKGQSLGEIEVKENWRAGMDDAETAQGCHMALRRAMIVLQKHARKNGGNAVAQVYSIHGDKVLKSNSQYYCGVGRAKTEVRLKGTIIRSGTTR